MTKKIQRTQQKIFVFWARQRLLLALTYLYS